MTINEELLIKFKGLGMSTQKATETLKNTNVTRYLTSALEYVPEGIDLNTGVGMLLYHMASKIKPQNAKHLSILVKLITGKQLDTTLRVDTALEYLLQQAGTTKNSIDLDELKKICGVGIVVSPEEIERHVDAAIKLHCTEILTQRYRYNVGKLLQEIRGLIPWADGKHIKNEVDVQLFDLLGEKTAADLAPPQKQENKKLKPRKLEFTTKEGSKEKNEFAPLLTLSGANSIGELMKTKVHFHATGDNYKTDGYVITEHTERLLKEHLTRTGGKVRTRFPPEPNGILHIGHAKAININFGYAAAYNGTCFLRYDDTNPEKEEEKFFVAIKDIVEWLGYKPDRTTHSSDNFQQLFEWAVVLIGKGLAYVCHQKQEDMKGFNPPPSPWRDRPTEESLQLFLDMKNGKIDEGKATLRMKITLEEGKQDPVAYRIKFLPHHRTKDAWCIYPTYDYTHCLCDSIEDITHSLCTKEFQSRRSSYYWLCNALDIYCPVQWEYGRLNVNYTVVSKRKIAKLITEGIVQDWDDPRLFTLTALRRRGFPSEAINNFCAQMGVTGAQISIDPVMIDAFVRDYLNAKAPRRFVVLEPLKVTITNFPFEKSQRIDVPNFPFNPERGSNTIIFDRIVYIEHSDFKEQPEKGYRRLSVNQTVGLRHTNYVIKIVEVIKDKNTLNINELLCSCEHVDTAVKPKAFIQWVSQPMEIEVRLYELLFRHRNPEDPNEVPEGFLSDCNKDSLTILTSYTDKSLGQCAVYDKYQFERIGFFSVDPDTTEERIVFNRTVTLKEDAGKI